jgi:hypothetical protein
MDAREGHHATRSRDLHGPIDHPDHEDHDPGREVMKGGVRTAIAGIASVEVFGPVADHERAAWGKGDS